LCCPDLFQPASETAEPEPAAGAPLAERMCLRDFAEFVGHEELLRWTGHSAARSNPTPSLGHSLGPGCGKTRIAGLIARHT
jgi:replication-associated recombination protein RarA